MVQMRKVQTGQMQFMVDLQSTRQRHVQATNAAQRRRTRLVTIEQPLMKGTWTTASVGTQEVWQEARSVAGRVIVPKSASGCRRNVSTHQSSNCVCVCGLNTILLEHVSDYRRQVPRIEDPHSIRAQL